jgi:hypothetical protein
MVHETRQTKEVKEFNYVPGDSHPPVDAIEEPGGVIVSYGEDKEPVSVEFMNASVRKIVLPGEVSVTIQTESLNI